MHLLKGLESTALMLAARHGAWDGARLLLQRGADASLRDARGLSAADHARQVGRDRLAEELERPVR